MQVAIDGPAGAGKSTVALLLAQRLQAIYVDTGAMYRALTWKALREHIPLDDGDQLTDLASHTEIHFLCPSNQQRIYCDHIDVTDQIRIPEINEGVSLLASHSQLRAVMVEKQQQMAEQGSVIMEGRDVGECILPQANYKIFLTANIKDRALRRCRELAGQGHEAGLETIEDLLRQRDKQDSKREMGALKVLEDSIIIDSSNLSVEEVLQEILSIIEEGEGALPVS
jgi:cytidylate kinase